MSYRAMSGSGLGFTFGGSAEGGVTIGGGGVEASGSASGGGNVEEEVRTQEEKAPPAWTIMDPILPYVPMNVGKKKEQEQGGVPWMWIGLGVAGLIAVGGIVYVVRRRS